MGGDELVDERRYLPVRCIICHRIKQPLSEAVSVELQGMRCELDCPGYTLDPPPPSASAPFRRYHEPVQPPAASQVTVPVGDLPVDVIGRALCEVHFGV